MNGTRVCTCASRTLRCSLSFDCGGKRLQNLLLQARQCERSLRDAQRRRFTA